jgi:EAL domain-containing protein (putative c-di-GMP-specific phosphodiesterase class I)/GGDEF domain-containing protein
MRWGLKSEGRKASGTSRRLAKDEVTGLLTYAAFLHECSDALTAYVDPGTPAEPAVLLVDLEGVTAATESEHNAATDEVVSLMAGRIAREVGSLGVLARMSDQQVGVLFHHLPAPAVALDLAYRIVAAVSSPAALASERRVQLSASCGLVTRDSVGPRATAPDLLRGAGLAVREARRSGRNRIEVCTPDLVAVADETLAIGKDLRRVLQDKGLRVCYQPLVDLTDGTVLGFEALVRWSHPVHGHVSPSRFVPVAEQFGLISELGRMVLSTASAQVHQWSTTFGIPLDAHVNVSGLDLAKDTFVGMVSECLESSGLPAARLVLEVTEAAVEPEIETARRRFDALHGLGVRVALDDFGTGRSALAYLQSLAVDILKVDRSYLDSIGEDEAGSSRADDLLRGVIGLGQAFGMDVYGEGIEDEPQRMRLRRNGCEIGQGYLFARPLPAEDAAALLRAQTTPVGLTRR